MYILYEVGGCTYLGLLDGGLNSELVEDVDGGRKSDEDEEERTSREPAIPTATKNGHLSKLKLVLTIYFNTFIQCVNTKN